MPASGVRYDREANQYYPFASCRCGARIEGERTDYGAAYRALADATFASRLFTRDGRTERPRTTCRTCNAAAARARRERIARDPGLAANANRATRRRAGWTRPADRRYGVEIELIYPARIRRNEIQVALAEAGHSDWRVKSDGSLRGNGWEVVSPVLQGERGHDALRRVCAILTGLGGAPTKACGLHVHHEATDLGGAGLARVVRAYHANQAHIDALMAPSRRGHANVYATPWSDRACGALRNVTRIEEVRAQQGGRYKVLNLNCYPHYGTIEFRQHGGTVNAAKISAWIRFGQHLIEAVASGDLAAQPTVFAMVRSLPMDEDTQTYLVGRAAMLAGGIEAAA